MPYAKSILFTVLGATPGIVLAIVLASPYYLFIAFLGGFIGFAFSLKGTSLRRVASLTTSVVVSHNLPGVGHQLTAIIEKRERAKEDQKRKAESEYDFRKLPFEENLIRLTRSAVDTIQQLRPNWGLHAPIRAHRWKEADGRFGVSLAYVDEWDPNRDVWTESGGIHLIVDRDAVPLLRGMIVVSPPNWEPAQFEFYLEEEMAKKPITTQEVGEESSEKKGFPWGIVFAVVVACTVFFVQMVRNPPANNNQNALPPAPAPANDPNALQEKMKNGEDIPEPLLILVGVDPAEYKKRQEEIRKAKLEQESKPTEEANPRPNP